MELEGREAQRMPRGRSSRSSTVDHALQILAMFLNAHRIGIAEIQNQLGISRTATVRLLDTLSDHGFLTASGRPKHYELGPMLHQLANRHQPRNLVAVARPLLRELMDSLQETVYLTVRSGTQSVLLEGLEPDTPVKYSLTMGFKSALHEGAPGKVYMAYMSPSELKAYLDRVRVEAPDPALIPDPETLREELQRVRAQEWAVNLGETVPDAFAVASPVWDNSTQPVACIGVAVPISRLSPEKLTELQALVPKYARKITTALRTKSG